MGGEELTIHALKQGDGLGENLIQDVIVWVNKVEGLTYRLGTS